MKIPITIRQATAQDAPPLALLAAELGYPGSEQQITRRLEGLASNQGHTVLVAERSGGPPVGWIHVFATLRLAAQPFAEIGGLIVTESERGRGIGSRLLEAAEKWAFARGISNLRIRSRTSRTDSHQVFRKAGYSEIKTQVVFQKSGAGRNP